MVWRYAVHGGASNLSHSQRAARQMETTNDATRLLEAWRQGVAGAADALFALVYDDLRTLARRQLARLNAGQTLAPTVLVHEAYLKFAERSAPHALDRKHFLAIASRAMRHVVVDHIRHRQARKRNGGVKVPFDTRITLPKSDSPVDLIAMDESLARLETLDPRQASIVDMRFFGGLELNEIAAALDVSERTVKRDWKKARAFLHAALR
jgi:RNA polymerase sigma factor (TIGR02999 family)